MMDQTSEPDGTAQVRVADLLARYGEPSAGGRHRRRAADDAAGANGNGASGAHARPDPLEQPGPPVGYGWHDPHPHNGHTAEPTVSYRSPDDGHRVGDQTPTVRDLRPATAPAEPDRAEQTGRIGLFVPATGDGADQAPAEHIPDGGHGRDEREAPVATGSPAREWATVAVQVGAGVAGGAVLWMACQWLWQTIPVLALIVALAVIIGLVWVVRRVRRAEDLQTTVIAVVVGLFVTVSPAALLLVGH